MAGCPIRRARNAGIRADDGGVITFPYMPRVADLPRGWRHWSPAQKIEHLLGISLDRAHEILSSRPVIELDPHRLNVLTQVWRVGADWRTWDDPLTDRSEIDVKEVAMRINLDPTINVG